MKNPLVSVIIPNYNYARYLAGRIDSVLGQTFQDFEVIILDDCSTDDSGEIIESYRDNPKVKAILYNEENSCSPFRQWAKGISMARGKYVWIAEADDLAEAGFLSETVGIMEADDTLALVFVGSHIIDSDGKPSRIIIDGWNEGQYDPVVKKYDGPEFVVHNMYWANCVYNASGVLFRRSVLHDEDMELCVTMRNSGDWLFWMILMSRGNYAKLYKKLNYYRVHRGNTTARGMKSGEIFKEDLRVIEYVENHFRIGRYRSIIRHGQFVKKLKRSGLAKEKIKELVGYMKTIYPFAQLEYIIERINKTLQTSVLPSLLSEESDRI